MEKCKTYPEALAAVKDFVESQSRIQGKAKFEVVYDRAGQPNNLSVKLDLGENQDLWDEVRVYSKNSYGRCPVEALARDLAQAIAEDLDAKDPTILKTARGKQKPIIVWGTGYLDELDTEEMDPKVFKHFGA